MQETVIETFKEWLLEQTEKTVVVRTWIYEEAGKSAAFESYLFFRQKDGILFGVLSSQSLKPVTPHHQQLGPIPYDHPGLDQELRKWIRMRCDDFLDCEQVVTVRQANNSITSAGTFSPEIPYVFGMLFAEIKGFVDNPKTSQSERFLMQTVVNRLSGFLNEQFSKFKQAKQQLLEVVSSM